MLLNLTNHPVSLWPKVQLTEAEQRWGRITDLPFPAVDPNCPICEVIAQAREIVRRASVLNPSAVLCQGEMTMTVALVRHFQLEGIPVYAACSHREVTEQKEKSGTVRKNSRFCFVQFREYPKFES